MSEAPARPAWMPGLELSRLFYAEAVRPLLDAHFPGLAHSAALLGDGSEVLGFDTEMSSDHDWGPRLLLFLREDEAESLRAALDAMLRRELPRSFRGWPVNFSPPSEEPGDIGTQSPVYSESGPVNHRVEILSWRAFLQAFLAFDPTQPLAPADWLTFPQQKLRALTAGAVYHDGIGLAAERERLAWYPRDVWLYLLAAGWNRIGQKEHLMGRAGYVGDEIGSAIIGARLARDLMLLCFLMERQYAPYPKWFGTAFAKLECAAELAPLLRGALAAASWQEREAHLAPAYEIVAAKQNALGLTEPRPAQAAPFFGRPFRVIHLHALFADALLAAIREPEMRRIAAKRILGGIDQFSDNTDLISYSGWRANLCRLFD